MRVHMEQIFIVCTSLVSDIHPIKSKSQFSSSLQDNITCRGAPKRLITDCSKEQISSKVKEIMRQLHIGTWTSEQYHHHQNYAERLYQHIKSTIKTVLYRTNAPPSTWYLCMKYVCFVLNYTYNNTISAIPMQKLVGSKQEISPLLRFHFWE